MTLNDWFRHMVTIEPAEPRGWFRWLHNHYMGRYGDHHPAMVLGDAFPGDWKRSRSEDDPEEEPDRQALIAFFERHAWACGMKKHSKILGSGAWDHLTPIARGRFLAGLSELHFGKDTDLIDKVLAKIGSADFDPESLCQLACNAIKFKRQDLLEALLTKYPSPVEEIRRFSASERRDSWESKELEKVSLRVIDMILEAALIQDDINATTIALEHGADPNIPIWQLERSYNQKYSALGYVIDANGSRDVQSRMGMIDLLLDHGASAAGTPFGGFNNELFLAFSKGSNDLAERLISHGASLSKQGVKPEGEFTRTAGSETTVISPGGPGFFGYFGDKLKWAHENIGSIVPLVPVSEKPAFYTSDAQGGSNSTFMDMFIGNLDRLKHYEALGLDTRLTAEELCSAVSCGAFDSLVYLFGKHGESARDRAMFRIRRFKPDIGTAWRHMDMVPQGDGVNSADEFDPEGRQSFVLPDGSSLFPDLSAIAKPGHNLGPCPEGHFWLRKDTVILRRRKDRVIVYKLHKKWCVEPFPLRAPGTRREQQYLDECIPVIRQIDGKFIHLGITLGRLWWVTPDGPLRDAMPRWNETPGYDHVQDQAEQMIKEQDSWNSRPAVPLLSEYELWGYPPEFWPYLVRLDNGFVSMTADSCLGNFSLLSDYKSWARKAKQLERDYVPDQRLLEWEYWPEVPAEYKPYYYWDTMFGDRGGVTMGSYDNKYEKAMATKVRNWHDRKWMEWMKAKRAKQE